jgi:hypothetical protein
MKRANSGEGDGGISAKKPHAISAEEQGQLDKQLFDNAMEGRAGEVERLLRGGAAADGHQQDSKICDGVSRCTSRARTPRAPFA